MDQSLLAEEAKKGIRPCQIWVDSWEMYYRVSHQVMTEEKLINQFYLKSLDRIGSEKLTQNLSGKKFLELHLTRMSLGILLMC